MNISDDERIKVISRRTHHGDVAAALLPNVRATSGIVGCVPSPDALPQKSLCFARVRAGPGGVLLYAPPPDDAASPAGGASSALRRASRATAQTASCRGRRRRHRAASSGSGLVVGGSPPRSELIESLFGAVRRHRGGTRASNSWRARRKTPSPFTSAGPRARRRRLRPLSVGAAEEVRVGGDGVALLSTAPLRRGRRRGCRASSPSRTPSRCACPFSWNHVWILFVLRVGEALVRDHRGHEHDARGTGKNSGYLVNTVPLKSLAASTARCVAIGPMGPRRM